MRHVLIILSAPLLLFTAGCSSYGPHAIYGPSGVIEPRQPQNLSVYDKFISAAKLAYDDPSRVVEMRDIGRDLVEINCHEFYRRMGRNERTSRITRNLILPITTALNGLMALRDWTNNTDSKEDLLQVINIAAAGGTTGLDLYDQHFLFKSENIDAVRTMTMKEIHQYRDANRPAPTSFSDAIRDLRHFENLCTPAHIVVTARKRIEGTP